MTACRRRELCSSFTVFVYCNARSFVLVTGVNIDAESWTLQTVASA